MTDRSIVSLSLSLASLLGVAALAIAHDGEKHGDAPDLPSRGGIAASTKAHRFEVLFHAEGVFLHAHDSKGHPVDLRGATGSVEVAFDDPKRRALKAPLRYVAPPKVKGAVGHLACRLDLTRLAEGKAKATFSLKGLASSEEPSASFEVPFQLARIIEWVCPMKCVPPAAVAGSCAKCKMKLVRQESIFVCPMHPGVTARTPAKCWTCKMPLKKQRTDGKTNEGHGEGKGHGGHGGH